MRQHSTPSDGTRPGEARRGGGWQGGMHPPDEPHPAEAGGAGCRDGERRLPGADEGRRVLDGPSGTTVAVVGVGRAGAAMGVALAAAGHEITAVYAHSAASRARATTLFPQAVILPTPAVAALRADVVLLAVPDDRIAPTAEGIAHEAAAGGAGPVGRAGPAGGGAAPAPSLAGRLVAHLSGRHGIAPLEAVRALGAHPVALHPIMTLAGTGQDAARLTGATFGVTVEPGDDVALAAVTRLVADVGGRLALVPEQERPVYHAALVLGGNFLATLVAAATGLLADAGVPDPAQALGPLLRASLDNALVAGEAAMTGPVRRGDVGTVSVQRSRLAERDGHLAAAYAALGVLTADRLEQAGLLAPSAAGDIRAALSVQRRPVSPRDMM